MTYDLRPWAPGSRVGLVGENKQSNWKQDTQRAQAPRKGMDGSGVQVVGTEALKFWKLGRIL